MTGTPSAVLQNGIKDLLGGLAFENPLAKWPYWHYVIPGVIGTIVVVFLIWYWYNFIR